jgi:hypothetical protein
MIKLLILIVAGIGVGFALTLVFWGVLTLARPILDIIKGALHPVAMPSKGEVSVSLPTHIHVQNEIQALPHTDINEQMQGLMESPINVIDIRNTFPPAVRLKEEELWSQVQASLFDELTLQTVAGQYGRCLPAKSTGRLGSYDIFFTMALGEELAAQAKSMVSLFSMEADPKFPTTEIRPITLVGDLGHPPMRMAHSKKDGLVALKLMGQHRIEVPPTLNTESIWTSATAQELAKQGAPSV